MVKLSFKDVEFVFGPSICELALQYRKVQDLVARGVWTFAEAAICFEQLRTAVHSQQPTYYVRIRARRRKQIRTIVRDVIHCSEGTYMRVRVSQKVLITIVREVVRVQAPNLIEAVEQACRDYHEKFPGWRVAGNSATYEDWLLTSDD